MVERTFACVPVGLASGRLEVRGDGHRRANSPDDLWDDGTVEVSLTLDGSVTLTIRNAL